jgi:hypothetical protein
MEKLRKDPPNLWRGFSFKRSNGASALVYWAASLRTLARGVEGGVGEQAIDR